MPNAKHASLSFGASLRDCRKRVRMSQLDLSLEANVSARHISFLESGRARPSREMVHQLCESMGLSLRARNEMLEQAGFASSYRETNLDATALAPIRQALSHMLDSHMPFPALVCDRHWTLADANPSAHAILAPLADGGDRNLIRMIARSPAAHRMIVNWRDVMSDMRSRLRLELRRSGHDSILLELIEVAESALGCESNATDQGPFVPVRLDLGDRTLSLMSILSEFGTPRDITVADLRIELFFPADRETEAYFRSR